MISEIDILILAYRLSVLTFYLGVLVYAIPIPYSGLKRWAPRLIVDGGISAALAFSLRFLLELSDRVASMMGGSWEYFNSWLYSGAAEFLTIKTVYALVKTLPDPLGVLGGLVALLRPLDKIATTALYFLGVIGGLAWLVKNYGSLLAALGVALYAIPFRIARGSGAWLISFVLVFSTGLQVLPVFVNTMSQSEPWPGFGPIAENGIALLNASVKTIAGPSEGELHVRDYSTGEEYAIYQVVDGRVLDDKGLSPVTIPSKPSLAYSLQYLGVEFPLAPYPATSEDYIVRGGVWSILLSSPYAIHAGNGILVYTNGSVLNASLSGDELTAFIVMDEGNYLAIRYVQGCHVEIDSGGLSGPYLYSWEWRNVRGTTEKYYASSPGQYRITVYPTSCEGVKIDYELKNYVNTVEKYLSFYNLNFVEAYLLYWFTLPILYIAILMSTSYGLARLLGGRERLPVRIT